jgi:hypothetical protein
LSRYDITRGNQPRSRADVLPIREFLPHRCPARTGLSGSLRVDRLQRSEVVQTSGSVYRSQHRRDSRPTEPPYSSASVVFCRIRRRIWLSRLGPLIRYVSLDCRFGDRADASDVVRAAPQTGQIRLEPRKLFSKVVAGKSLELCCQSCWRHRRVTLNEHVNVVGHDFESVNLGLNFFRFSVQQLSQSLLKRIDKDALAILRAPHEVVLQRVQRTSVDSVAIIDHALISTEEFDSCQLSNQETDRFPRQRKQAVPSI